MDHDQAIVLEGNASKPDRRITLDADYRRVRIVPAPLDLTPCRLRSPKFILNVHGDRDHNLLFVLTGAEYDRLGLDGHPCVRLLHMASADVLLPVYFFQLVSVGGIVQRLLDREEVVAARRTVRADLDDSIIAMTLNFETRAIEIRITQNSFLVTSMTNNI